MYSIVKDGRGRIDHSNHHSLVDHVGVRGRPKTEAR
jgi:hypothetical protein